MVVEHTFTSTILDPEIMISRYFKYNLTVCDNTSIFGSPILFSFIGFLPSHHLSFHRSRPLRSDGEFGSSFEDSILGPQHCSRPVVRVQNIDPAKCQAPFQTSPVGACEPRGFFSESWLKDSLLPLVGFGILYLSG